MQRYTIGSTWNRDNRNGLNRNFEYLFEGADRISELNERARQLLDDAESINQMNANVQGQLDNLVIESGNANAEVSQARGNYSVLRDRLDSSDSILTDFIDDARGGYNSVTERFQTKETPEGAQAKADSAESSAKSYTDDLAQFINSDNSDVLIVEESGGNSDGEFIRYSDGTQICWRYLPEVSTGTSSVTLLGNQFFRNSNAIGWNYPKPFIDTPSVTAQAGLGTNVLHGTHVRTYAQQYNRVNVQFIAFTNYDALYDISYIALGRWK